MRRPAAISVIILLFLTGVAVGVLGTNLVNHRRGGPGGRAGLGPRQEQSMVAELHRRLALSPDQGHQLDAIVSDTHHEALAMWRQMRQRLAERIEKILTPQQRQEFERYRQELAAQHQQRRQGRGR
jgi:hypothetical protein